MTKETKAAITDTSGAKQVQGVPGVSDAAPINRTYKSTLFIMLFQDKNNLLELYNAVSGKHYTDPEILEINTLENAIYMTVKNDISFLIDGRLSLYEHQSTYNPNLPLRFLIYIAKLYSRMRRNANLYGTKVIRIPPPEFLIFYNGKEELPDAVERAIRECIAEGVLKDFLEKHRAEAKEMSIFEYDQEKHMRQEREDAWADGHLSGMKEGIAKGEEHMLITQIRKKLARGKTASVIAEELEETEERIRELIDRIGQENS